MKTYLLSIYQPDGPAPDADTLETVMRELAILNEEIVASGGLLFTDGLQPPGGSTVVCAVGDGRVELSEGAYLSGPDHLGGLWIIRAPHRDAAVAWARKAALATGLPIEVRSFQS
ncbi:YciI family protein [Klugiella xanthotipulae]|uniref:YCII-related domain-containing protein n=1 Tax=Klugiella xanthotipulae TaxID=244735 RepID=A0A543I5X8_9MICO|nr:YciI family protein [Klugiella xanthotipulae]TQM65951.1 hypothetical protein FB466_0771 [Klugiella xanthotipulae]